MYHFPRNNQSQLFSGQWNSLKTYYCLIYSKSHTTAIVCRIEKLLRLSNIAGAKALLNPRVVVFQVVNLLFLFNNLYAFFIILIL